MKFAIVTLYDNNRKDFGELTSPIARQYSLAQGYSFSCIRESLDQSRHTQWSKILAVRRELDNDHDWILWLDADALIVQPRITLESLVNQYGGDDKDLLFSEDKNGLCSGVFLIRNTAWSKTFLDTVYFLGAQENCGHLHEQFTMQTVVTQFPSVQDRIALIPDSVIQNPDSTFNPSGFIMHYWAATKPFALHQDKIMNISCHGWKERFF